MFSTASLSKLRAWEIEELGRMFNGDKPGLHYGSPGYNDKVSKLPPKTTHYYRAGCSCYRCSYIREHFSV